MGDFDISDLIDYLSEQSIANVQNGLVDALARWMDEHIQGDSAMQQKEEAWYIFRDSVSVTLHQTNIRRKIWPENQPLPDLYNNMDVIRSISQKACQKIKAMAFEEGLISLGQIWGTWILVLPYKMYMHSHEFESRTASQRTDSQLIADLFEYLDIGYGMMGTL